MIIIMDPGVAEDPAQLNGDWWVKAALQLASELTWDCERTVRSARSKDKGSYEQDSQIER
jgi:hypothetical protein